MRKFKIFIFEKSFFLLAYSIVIALLFLISNVFNPIDSRNSIDLLTKTFLNEYLIGYLYNILFVSFICAIIWNKNNEYFEYVRFKNKFNYLNDRLLNFVYTSLFAVLVIIFFSILTSIVYSNNSDVSNFSKYLMLQNLKIGYFEFIVKKSILFFLYIYFLSCVYYMLYIILKRYDITIFISFIIPYIFFILYKSKIYILSPYTTIYYGKSVLMLNYNFLTCISINLFSIILVILLIRFWLKKYDFEINLKSRK